MTANPRAVSSLWPSVCAGVRVPAGCGRYGGRSRLVSELLGQRTAIAPEDGPSRGLDRRPAVVGHGASRGDEHAAGLAEEEPAGPLCRSSLSRSAASRCRSSRTGARSRSRPRRLTVFRATPLHELADDNDVVGSPPSGQHDRPVAGDGERPEARLSQPVGGDGVRRTQGRTRKEHGCRQAVIRCHVVDRQAEAPQLLPGSGRERFEGTLCGGERLKLLGEGDGLVPAVGSPGDKSNRPSAPGASGSGRRRLNSGSSTRPSYRRGHRRGRAPPVAASAPAQEPCPICLVFDAAFAAEA